MLGFLYRRVEYELYPLEQDVTLLTFLLSQMKMTCVHTTSQGLVRQILHKHVVLWQLNKEGKNEADLLDFQNRFRCLPCYACISVCLAWIGNANCK